MPPLPPFVKAAPAEGSTLMPLGRPHDRMTLVTAALCMATASTAVRAQDAHARMPCLHGVCVGDELRSLLALAWQRAVVSNSAGPAASLAARIGGSLRGHPAIVETVLRYWPGRWFDGPALQALAALDAVCEDIGVWWRPRASFTAAHGQSIVATFEAVPSSGAGAQPFRVATLSLRLPGDAVELREELSARYAGYPTYPTDDEPGVRWLTDAQGNLSVKLFAPIEPGAQRANALRAQARCHAR